MALLNSRHIRTIPLPAIFAAAALTLVLLAGGLYAKYVSEASAENDALASEFYFTSNMLTEDGQAYTLPVGTTEFAFELRNSEDDLRWSAKDVSYTCAVTGDDDGAAAPAIAPDEGTLSANSSTATTATINVSNLTAGTYTVSATASSPLSKTLKAKVVIPEADETLTVKVEDSAGSPYALMTVSTKEYSGDITISWTEGLIPDSTQSDFANVTSNSTSGATAGSTTVSLGSYSSNTYRFFKTDKTQNYSTGSSLSASAA